MTSKKSLDKVVQDIFEDVEFHPSGATSVRLGGDWAVYWEEPDKIAYRIGEKSTRRAGVRRVAWELLMWKIDSERSWNNGK